MIISGGSNVYEREDEDALPELAGIAGTAEAGVPLSNRREECRGPRKQRWRTAVARNPERLPLC